MIRVARIALLTLLLTSLAVAAPPDRYKGISMHMLPKRVADLGGDKWGLTITQTGYLTTDAASTTLQTVPEFIAFVCKQSAFVKENGVWIVTTNPAAYSSEEQNFLKEVVAACKKGKILLFIARASELPNGWKQYN